MSKSVVAGLLAALFVAGVVSGDSLPPPVVSKPGTSAAQAVMVQGSSSGVPVPVSGSVTVSGVAQDATLTGGTAKAIVRGGAKGSTSAADVTSTAVDANHQGLDVILNGATSNITANQGSPQTLANRWPVIMTDGTNTMPTGDASARTIHTTLDNTPAVTVGRDSAGAATKVICDKSAFVNPTTATTTQIVALSASTVIYVCAYQVNFVGSATANTAIFKYGTGASCGTGTTALSGTLFGPTATGSGSQFSMGSGVGYVMKTIAAQALCITTSAATTVGATVSYAQF